MKNALISGAGIAGLTTAYWLAKNNWQVTILEKASSERTEGYVIDFYGEGWDVAEKMGVTDKIKAIKYPIDDVQIVNRHGNPYFSFPVQRMIDAFADKYRPIRRPDLEHILLTSLDGLPATIHYNTVVDAIENTSTHCNVRLSNGKEQTFDIVVGADGVHSNIRTLVFGEEENFSHYLGYFISFFHTKRDPSIGNSMCLYQEPNRQFGMYPYSPDEMDVLYILRSNERKRVPRSEYKSFLLKKVSGMGWKAKEILENTPEAAITLLDTTEQIRMKQWHKNRVVLVGDAVACPTLAAGQGASMAMTESYILADQLARYDDSEKAFTAYHDSLAAKVLSIQLQAEKFAKNFVPATQFGVTSQRWLMRAAMSPLFMKKAMSSFTKTKLL